MVMLVMLVLAGDPLACLPVPSEVERYGEDAVAAYKDGLKLDDPKAPKLAAAPADARLLLRLIWAVAGKKNAVKGFRVLMDPQFTWQYGQNADADEAVAAWATDAALPKQVRAAIAGTCKTTRTDVTCTAKTGPGVELEKKDGCWRWTGFVEVESP
jgi:hypothetical protein